MNSRGTQKRRTDGAVVGDHDELVGPGRFAGTERQCDPVCRCRSRVVAWRGIVESVPVIIGEERPWRCAPKEHCRWAMLRHGYSLRGVWEAPAPLRLSGVRRRAAWSATQQEIPTPTLERGRRLTSEAQTLASLRPELD